MRRLPAGWDGAGRPGALVGVPRTCQADEQRADVRCTAGAVVGLGCVPAGALALQCLAARPARWRISWHGTARSCLRIMRAGGTPSPERRPAAAGHSHGVPGGAVHGPTRSLVPRTRLRPWAVLALVEVAPSKSLAPSGHPSAACAPGRWRRAAQSRCRPARRTGRARCAAQRPRTGGKAQGKRPSGQPCSRCPGHLEQRLAAGHPRRRGPTLFPCGDCQSPTTASRPAPGAHLEEGLAAGHLRQDAAQGPDVNGGRVHGCSQQDLQMGRGGR